MPAGQILFIMPCFNNIKHCIIYVLMFAFQIINFKKKTFMEGEGVIKF